MTLVAVTPPLDLKSRVAAFVRTPIGRLVLVWAFVGITAAKAQYWWQVGVVLSLTSLWPAHRRAIIAAAAACWVFLRPPIDFDLLRELAGPRGATHLVQFWPAAVAATWLLTAGYLWLVRRFPTSPVGRHPIMGLLALLVALLALTALPLDGLAWFAAIAIAMVFGKYVWFFAYWISENHSRAKTPSVAQIGAWRPFWGFTHLPYGKGNAYLDHVEARDDDQLAAAQWSGLKLLVRAAAFSVLFILLAKLLYGQHDGSLQDMPRAAAGGLIPTYAMAVDAQLHGQPYAWPVRWAALIAYWFLYMLALTVAGHKIIAIARMAGFNAFRNTYRPLTATSIAEFYNRLHWYFKELLVAFFFYPTYLRYLKRWPRLRIFVATLAAAGLGNFLFHFLREDEAIFRHGLWRALVAYHSYALYALILGVTIGLSQLRANKQKGKRLTGVGKAFAIAGVLLFFTVMAVFEDENPRPLREYATFLVSLVVP